MSYRDLSIHRRNTGVTAMARVKDAREQILNQTKDGKTLTIGNWSTHTAAYRTAVADLMATGKIIRVGNVYMQPGAP